MVRFSRAKLRPVRSPERCFAGYALIHSLVFTNDLGADSLDTVELIMEFEKEFNISIPDEQAETITTVGQAVAYLEEHAK